MNKNHIIDIEGLKQYGSVETISEQANSLVLQQQATWQLVKKNFEALKYIKTRLFNFDNFKVLAQFNPERIRSSAAKTDAKTIAERPCFLCMKNLPAEQKGFLILEKYLVLTNPYPIFPFHLTVSSLNHTPQLIQNRIDDLLVISRLLTGFTTFYNGPDCGASAPDHFHFQAAVSGFIPVENEISNNSETILNSGKLKISASKNYLRNFIAIESESRKEITQYFNLLLNKLAYLNQEPEPMLNILCRYFNNKWQLVIFPRNKQRPYHFFKKGNEQIIIGPASVEMGGLLILPRKEDFDKLTKKEIIEIYNDVSLNINSFENFLE
ncbi:MAG: DUF4922 domain-containing protein [Prolixibacteraceae bacterium]|nr:DUF4922 domain-containing protein [Prolixibacteraceae bacterium]MBN2774835.1 DUF4922 domain-containing protein [Prolixibacteraceae bacterium]